MSADEYRLKFDYMISRLKDTMYFFDVCKMCGYGEIVMISKEDTLADLYKMAARQYGMEEIENLVLRNEESGETRRIPNTNLSVRDYVKSCYQNSVLRYFLRPAYEAPANVVYRVYFDDGHKH
jgi:hypothetical protein